LKNRGRDGAEGPIDKEFADLVRRVLESEAGFQNIRVE
jgi:hypothetical protein